MVSIAVSANHGMRGTWTGQHWALADVCCGDRDKSVVLGLQRGIGACDSTVIGLCWWRQLLLAPCCSCTCVLVGSCACMVNPTPKFSPRHEAGQSATLLTVCAESAGEDWRRCFRALVVAVRVTGWALSALYRATGCQAPSVTRSTLRFKQDTAACGKPGEGGRRVLVACGCSFGGELALAAAAFQADGLPRGQPREAGALATPIHCVATYCLGLGQQTQTMGTRVLMPSPT